MIVEHIPCGPFVNESERLALEKIRSKLQSASGNTKYIILTNLLFSFDSKGLSDEIDMIILYPGGIVVVETKHWDGKYIVRNIRTVEDEADRLNNKVKKIAGLLRRHNITLGFIEGKLLLTRGDVPKDKVINGIGLYSPNSLVEFLKETSKPLFADTSLKQVCHILEPKTRINRSGDIRSFGPIRNLELISNAQDRFHRVYKGEHLSRRDKVILHIYDLSAMDTSNAYDIARREFDVIQRLQKLPQLPRIMDSFQDAPGYPGELYFYSLIDPSSPTLREIARHKDISLKERLVIAMNCLERLNELHNPIDEECQYVIHRRLNPDNIKIKNRQNPIFTDFTYAKLPDNTISPFLNQISKDDEFMAPELKSGSIFNATTLSDTYSLCKCLSLLFEYENNVLDILNKGLSENPSDRLTLMDIHSELKRLDIASSPVVYRQMTIPHNLWDEDTIVEFKGNSYKIVNKLGSGGMGTTFKVVQINKKDGSEIGSFVAKVIHSEDNGIKAIEAYNKIRPHINPPNLSLIYEIASHWEADNFTVLMKWIEGITLSDLVGVLPLYADDIGEESTESMVLLWIQRLCDALGRLHSAGFVHGDVTPKNIIVSGGDVILIDYDTVKEIGSVPEVFTLQYCSRDVEDKKPITPSDDIFSLASSFYHALFDKEPFIHTNTKNKTKGLSYEGLSVDEYLRLIKFFDRAVNPERSKRFKDALEARDFLIKGNLIQTEVAIINESQSMPSKNEVSWLKDVLRAYPGSRYGNDETRGLDSEFALKTYVETTLDRAILVDILNKRVSLVILLGNAGDGKTAFLQNLAKNLGMPIQHSSQRLWDFTIENGLRVKANLDGSASYQGKSANDLLDQFFEPYLDNSPPKDLVSLLAINSGPLQAWLSSYSNRDSDSPLVQSLQSALEGDFSLLPEGYRFIDLNNRSLVGNTKGDTIDTSFLDSLISSLVGQRDYWEPCATCIAQDFCHIKEVIDILFDDNKARLFKERLYLSLQAVHHRGEAHITMRELRAALIYILFSIYHCKDIHNNPNYCNERYYDRAFDPNSIGRQGIVLKEMSYFNPALNNHPKIDRYIVGRCIRDSGMPPQYENLPIASARRRIYFEWTEDDFIKVSQYGHHLYGLAKGKHLEKFNLLPFIDEQEKKAICRDLCIGISRLEDLPPQATKFEGIPIRITPRTVTETLFFVIKPFNRFSLRPLINNNDNYLENLHTHIELTYTYENGETESLIMGYELFYILLELKDGIQLTDAASEDIFANLSIFTQRLAQEHSRQLFAWNPSDETVIYGIEIRDTEGKQKVFCQPLTKEVMK